MKLKILGIKPAVSKADNVYYKVQTSKGDMTAFDIDIVEALKEAKIKGKEINLNCVPSKDGQYMNIRGFAMDDPEQMAIQAEGEAFQEREVQNYVKPQEFGKTASEREAVKEYRKSVKGSAYEKDPVGLAVEVFNGLSMTLVNKDDQQTLMKLMTFSIDAVKQAQKAFS